MGSQGMAFTGSHVVKPLVRRLGLAVGLHFGASEAVWWCRLASVEGGEGGSGCPWLCYYQGSGLWRTAGTCWEWPHCSDGCWGPDPALCG